MTESESVAIAVPMVSSDIKTHMLTISHLAYSKLASVMTLLGKGVKRQSVVGRAA